MSPDPETTATKHLRVWIRRAAVGASLALVIAFSSIAQPEDTLPDETGEEVIEQILLLRQQLESLLETLPPELRDEVEERWQAMQQAEPPTPKPELEPEPTIPPPHRPETEPPESLELPEPTTVTRLTETPSELASSPEPRTTCGTLDPLDTNGDGLISSGDRYWRYLRLWFDNGNGTLEEIEIESLFDLGIRQIDVGMGSFKDSDDTVGDIDVDDLVRLHVHGKSRSGTRTGALIIEAGRLARGDELWLVDSAGTKLVDNQPLDTGLSFKSADGTDHPLSCP